MKTFVYKGTGDSLLALDAELKKGQPFTTDDPALIELLSHSANVFPYEEPKKPSPKKDADKS